MSTNGLLWLKLSVLLFCSQLFWLQAGELPKFKPDLNIGFYYPSIQTIVSRNDFEVSVGLWLEEITQEGSFLSFHVDLFDTIAAMREAFDQGQLAIIVGPPYLLAKYFDRDSLAEGFSGITLDAKPNGLIMLARNDKRIESIHDLRGKRLAMPLHNELAEVFLDYLTLKNYQQPFQKVFPNIKYQAQNSALIYEVFFNRADIALSYKETYDLMLTLNPQLNAKLKVLADYPFKAPNYAYFHKRYPDELRQRIIKNALKIQAGPRAQQILTALKMGGFTNCRVDELAPFDQLAEQYAALKRAHKK